MKVISLNLILLVFCACGDFQAGYEGQKSTRQVERRHAVLGSSYADKQEDDAQSSYQRAVRELKSRSDFFMQDEDRIIALLSTNKVVSVRPYSGSSLRVTRYQTEEPIRSKLQLQMSYLKFLDYRKSASLAGDWNTNSPDQPAGKAGSFSFSDIRFEERLTLDEIRSQFINAY